MKQEVSFIIHKRFTTFPAPWSIIKSQQGSNEPFLITSSNPSDYSQHINLSYLYHTIVTSTGKPPQQCGGFSFWFFFILSRGDTRPKPPVPAGWSARPSGTGCAASCGGIPSFRPTPQSNHPKRRWTGLQKNYRKNFKSLKHITFIYWLPSIYQK